MDWKDNGCSFLISETCFSRIKYEVTKYEVFLESKSDFMCCSEVVVGVLNWLLRDTVVTVC